MDAPDIGTIVIPAGFPRDANAIIGTLVPLVLAIAGLVFFAMLLLGGLRYISAGGDEKATQQSRQTLTNAFIGLIIVVSAFLVTQLLFALFGIDSLVSLG